MMANFGTTDGRVGQEQPADSLKEIGYRRIVALEAFFEVRELARQFSVRSKESAKLDKDSNDGDGNSDRTVAAQNARQHGHALFSEYPGRLAHAAAPAF